jgi:hypothetical protein
VQILVEDIKQNKLLYFLSRKNKHYFVTVSAVDVIWLSAVDSKVLLNKGAANKRGCQTARQFMRKRI